MKILPLLLPLLFVLVSPVAAESDGGAASEGKAVIPYEAGVGFEPLNAIDRCVLAELQQRGIEPSNPCSDAVFLRRVYVDVIGTLPDPWAVRHFLRNGAPDKRVKLIDELLEREEFVDYWTLKWGDVLRVKAEFPIKLWPNGVHTYHRWIRDAVKENLPYDEFARTLLTSSGSNFRVAPVNFYRAIQDRSAAGVAGAVALTFMGSRFDAWPEEKRAGMTPFFSRIVYKPTAEWKEEIIIADPAPAGPLKASFPDGRAVEIPGDVDPRRVFADWLITPRNPYFTKSIANRVWFWLLGRGIVHEPDDFREDNPPSNPALLTCLERELTESGYDLKHLFRFILSSRTYQGSSIPRSDDPAAEALFAHYKVRRLDAEVLIDALCSLDGRGVEYMSIVPEPFTYLPNMTRSVKLKDGTITSPFLEKFGRPARDTGVETERDNDPTDAQRLFLLNSSEIQRRLERSPWLRRLMRGGKRNRLGAIRPIYITLLSREPTPAELAYVASYFGEGGRNPREASVDLAWALINSKEFLYRH